MAVNKTFDCDICENTRIKHGQTMVFEIDAGDTGRKYHLKWSVVGVKDFTDAPKVTHICEECCNKIRSPRNDL